MVLGFLGVSESVLTYLFYFNLIVTYFNLISLIANGASNY